MTISSTPAGRLEIIHSLLHPEIVDDHGNFIAYAEPLITMEEALEILKLPTLPRKMEDLDDREV